MSSPARYFLKEIYAHMIDIRRNSTPEGALLYEGEKTWEETTAERGPARTGGVTDVRSLKMRRFMDRTSC